MAPARRNAQNKLNGISPSKPFKQSCSPGVMLLEGPGKNTLLKPLLCTVSCECTGEYQAVLLPPHPGSLPRLSFVGLNSPALPFLMFLVPLGFRHRVPGSLQQEKGQ